MAKVEIELVAEVLADIDIHPDKRARIIRHLQREAEKLADQAAAAREPAPKKQFVIILSDPLGEVPGDLELIGWVLQIPENDPPAVALDRLHRAAAAFNATKRGQKYPAKSFGEACEVVGGRFLKEHAVAVKTRIPVQVIRTDNELPPASTTGEPIHRTDLAAAR